MVRIPSGNTVIQYDFGNAPVLLCGVDKLKSGKPGIELVRRAMEAPIASPRLKELAKGKKNCTLIISDHTRPVPSQDILPPMLQELREGNPDIEITLLVATGFHRGTTEEELKRKLGEEIFGKEKIVIHDCRDSEGNVRLGILPSGAPLVIDRVAARAELLVSEGFIEPHFFAGFSGGRKSVLPGVCDKVTVLGNHCSKFIDSRHARTGILQGNPIHRDMVAAARMAKLAFVVNVIIDEHKRTVAAFAGDAEKAHEAGCDFLGKHCALKAVPGDIVITSNGGAPLDQNIYQCVKGLTAAEACAKPGAVLILCAEIADGHGGEDFYRALRDCGSVEELYRSIMETPQDKTLPDQWESQILARIRSKHKVIFVSPASREALLKEMKLCWAPTLQDAMSVARAEKGEAATVTVIPNGVSVIITK